MILVIKLIQINHKIEWVTDKAFVARSIYLVWVPHQIKIGHIFLFSIAKILVESLTLFQQNVAIIIFNFI